MQISFNTLVSRQKTVTPAKTYQSLSLAFPLCFPKAMGTAAEVSSLENDLSDNATATGPLAARSVFTGGGAHRARRARTGRRGHGAPDARGRGRGARIH